MFIATLFIIARTLKQHRHLSIEGWIKKIWYIHTMECYSAIKNDRIIPFAATWIDPGSMQVAQC